MRALPLIAFLLVANQTFSQTYPVDSTRTGKFRHFNIAFNWMEWGKIYALNSRSFEDLPEPASVYLNSVKSGTHFGFFGVMVYYKNTIGLGAMYNYSDFSPESGRYSSYLESAYPNHYTPKNDLSYSYSIESFFLNVSYRKQFRYFFVEPMLRIGFNSYDAYTASIRMKEKGTNQYIQLDIAEVYSGMRNSYQLNANIAHRFKEIPGFKLSFEVGAQGTFLVAPVKSDFTFKETPYGGASTTSTYSINRWNPALGWSVFINWYF